METKTKEEPKAQYCLSDEQKAEFHENGYIVLGKVFSDDEMQTMQEEYDRVFNEAFVTGNWRNIAIFDTPDRDAKLTATEKVHQIMQMCERSLLFRRLLYDQRLLDPVRSLIGPQIQLFHDQSFYKPARDGGEVPWHQDNGYWHLEPANVLSTWIACDRVDEANGAMQFIPGSHRAAIAHERENRDNNLQNIDSHVDTSRRVVVDLPLGGVLIHHCQTFHHTARNRSEGPRRAHAIHFMPSGTRRAWEDACIPVSWKHPQLANSW